MKLMVCLVASPSMVGLQDTDSQKHGIAHENNVNAMKYCKTPEPMKLIPSRHHMRRQKNAEKQSSLDGNSGAQ